MAPPGMTITGRFSRPAAMRWAGMDLSQEESSTRPSVMVDTAWISHMQHMKSREARE